MKLLKYVLYISIPTILIGLTACSKDEVVEVVVKDIIEEIPSLNGTWYVDPDNWMESDYYRFNENTRYDNGTNIFEHKGNGSHYIKKYHQGKSLSCNFTWEADETFLFLNYYYYDSYSKTYVEYTTFYYYAVSGKNLILYDRDFDYVGTYTKPY